MNEYDLPDMKGGKVVSYTASVVREQANTKETARVTQKSQMET